MMKKTIYAALLGAALLPTAGYAGVCSDGVGTPPFLTSGAKPNLLMVLDNSGSMLDAAYSKQGVIYQADGVTPVKLDSGIDATYQRCMDGDYDIVSYKVSGKTATFDKIITSVTGYDSSYSYGGYFKKDAWYQWIEPTGGAYDYPEWTTGTSYAQGKRVQAYGNVYEAVTAGTSVGAAIDKDTAVEWTKLAAVVPSLSQWGAGKTYPAKSFTWYGPQLYYTEEGGTSAGAALTDKLGVTDWKPVEHTWMSGESYASGSIVTYQGILYQSLTDSNQGNVPGKNAAKWQSLRQGEFQEVTADTAASHCAGAAGTKYSRTDNLCLTMQEIAAGGSVQQKKVTAFAARGNLLNWALASKFDVQKKILTGGKHNYHEQVLVGEHRGCSGSRLIKQIKLDASQGYLTLGVRGGKYENDAVYFKKDRVDSSDDTARLEVLAVTAAGMQISGQCQDMLDTILNKDPSGANWSQPIDACMATFPPPANDTEDITHQRPMLNHSLQFCSKYWKDLEDGVIGDDSLRNIKNVRDNCQALYEGDCSRNEDPCTAWDVPPYASSELVPAYGAYVCYGIYDKDISDATQRAGYVGRCWQPVQGSDTNCVPKLAVSAAAGGCNVASGQTFCTYGTNRAWFKNQGGYNYKCTDNNLNQCSGEDWKQQFIWDDGSQVSCTAGEAPPGATPAKWEAATDAAIDDCIIQASIDYCRDTAVPEVIDPSDQAGDTTKTWNVPGVVADSGIISMMGGDYPVATMKAYIRQPARPQGIIHNVQRDLRLGAMAFNSVGAFTECDDAYVTPGITRYCPDENLDGAKLLAELEAGDFVKDDNDPEYSGKTRRHVDELAAAINSVRGTSWTPLGEALYNALGYYTQNDSFCLNEKDAEGKCPEYCLETDPETGKCVKYALAKICVEKDDAGNCIKYKQGKDPVQYWCQDNHILLITEGESTTDVHPDVVAFASNPAVEDKTARFPSAETGDDLDGDGIAEPAFIPGTSTPCGDKLFRSTYLDDMTWWGQNAGPLYTARYFIDPDGRPTPKQNIFTHVVTTGALSKDGTGECSPETLMTSAAVSGGTTGYYPGENPQQLEDNLYAVFDDILSRSSAGSAASVISSSRSGSGAVYQAVFWPKHEDADKNKVTWVGDVHSLFVSADGRMYEDTNENGRLDLTGADLDKQVLFYFSNAANKTRGCYNITQFHANGGQCPEPAKSGDLVPACDGVDCVEITDIKYLWSANKKLAEMDVMKDRVIYTWNDANNNGIVDVDTADPDKSEWFKLTDLNKDKLQALNDIAKDSQRGPVGADFVTSDDWETFIGYMPRGTEDEAAYNQKQEQAALDALVKWLQGVDSLYDEPADDNGDGRLDKALRSRYFKLDPDNALLDTWRLGDVIHSTPIVVAKPAEAYHYIYRDPTYRDFVERWTSRRNMIYFGGNDGMLHAVNGGFYFENKNQFCCTNELNSDGSCKVQPDKGVCSGTSSLGQELWAYIPYNLQPHLKCLADKFYAHKYYVDQRPRIFDAQIFEQESACGTEAAPTLGAAGCVHAGGWGTILVGAMRFGGAPVEASTLNDDPNDKRLFNSAYFILDITDPEKPQLLGEMTQMLDENNEKVYADMGYTTSSPSMVIMRDTLPEPNKVKSDWHLVLGKGPTDQDGRNQEGSQNQAGGKNDTAGKIAVVPLNWLSGTFSDSDWKNGVPYGIDVSYNKNTLDGRKPFRIPNAAPSANVNSALGTGAEGGVFTVPGTAPSFISDIISVDYNINLTAIDDRGARYRTDAIYFGTVDSADFKPYPSDYLPGVPDQHYWNKGGRLFRMVTKMRDANGEEEASVPSAWAGAWLDDTASSQYSKGPLRLLIDTKMPVIGAPTIGYDGYNYWLYAGTGRFFGEKDKTDDGWCLDSSTNCPERSKISFFGLKEPLYDGSSTSLFPPNWKDPLPTGFDYKADPVMTWERIDWDINSQQNKDLPAAAVPPSKSPGQRGLMQTDNIIVAQAATSKYGSNAAYLECYHCVTDVNDRSKYSCTAVNNTSDGYCFPDNVKSELIEQVQDPAFPDDPTKKVDVLTFRKLLKYIAGTGFMTLDGKHYITGLDGWYRDFHDARERNLGTAALLGGLLTYTTYQPFNDKCQAEGESSLYGVHFQTGTAWIQNVFGTFNKTTGEVSREDGEFVMDKLSLGRGLSTSPSMHVGTGDHAAKAFIQTSTGEIIEVTQDNLPIGKQRSGRYNWTDRCGQ